MFVFLVGGLWLVCWLFVVVGCVLLAGFMLRELAFGWSWWMAWDWLLVSGCLLFFVFWATDCFCWLFVFLLGLLAFHGLS